MKIHCIQHVRFEVPGTINEWIEEKNHLLSTTHAYESENFPETGSFDFLLVMGGPMNIYEYDKYPWLKEEKEFLEKPFRKEKQFLESVLEPSCLPMSSRQKCLRMTIKR